MTGESLNIRLPTPEEKYSAQNERELRRQIELALLQVSTQAPASTTDGLYAAEGFFYNAGNVLVAGESDWLDLPSDFVITGAEIVGDPAGTLSVSVYVSSYAAWDTWTLISASAPLTLAASDKNQSAMTGWTTTFTGGRYLKFVITGTPTSVTKATATLKLALPLGADGSGPEPGGPAGGVLAGTYPSPTFAVDMATQAELDAAGVAGQAYTDAASAAAQAYTDARVAGLSWKQAVRAATTVAGTLASSFENGDTIDGVTLATGNRILVKDQSSGAENGIYVVAASGAPTRATDADAGAELVNATVYVSEGTTNADTQWTCSTNATITVGSTALVFAQLTSGGGAVSSVFGRTGAVVKVAGDYAVADVTGAAPLASPTFTGSPVAPTQSASDNSTLLATTAFVQAVITALKNGVSTAFDTLAEIATELGLKAPLASPAFTGNPTATTQSAGNNSTRLATTAYADAIAALKANLASPTFTGTPAAPTAAPATSTTQLATTAFVQAGLAAGGFGGSTVLYSVWDPFVPQSSPPSQSDEFTSDTSANYTLIYTGDAGVVYDWSTSATGALYIEATSNTYHIKSGLKAIPAGDFTLHFGGWLAATGDVASVGIILADGTTAGAGSQKLYGISSQGSLPQASAWFWNQFGNTPSGNVNSQFSMPQDVRFVRVRRVGSTYTASYSPDGRVWQSHSTVASAPGFTPTHFGWGFVNYSGSVATVAIDYLRYYATGTQYQTGSARTVYG